MKKKKPFIEEDDDEYLEIDEDSDFPVHERYTKIGKKKQLQG